MPTTTPILSTGARAELFFAVVLIALFLYAQDDLAACLTPQVPAVQMPSFWPCREPSEHEILLIAYVKRDGKVVRDGCTYAGSQSAYPKKPRPKAADAHSHD